MLFKKKKQSREAVEKPPFYDPKRAIHSILPCLFVAVAVLIGFFLVLDALGKNDSVLGTWLLKVLAGLFSHGMYAIPLLLLWQGVRWRADVRLERGIARGVYFALFLILYGAFYFYLTPGRQEIPYSVSAFFRGGVALSGPGLLGGTVGFVLCKLTGFIGVPFVLAVVLLLFFAHFLKLSPYHIKEKMKEKRAAAEAEAEPAPMPLVGGEDADGDNAPEQTATNQPPQAQTTTEKQEKGMTRKEKRELRLAQRRERKRLEADARELAARRQMEEDGYFPPEEEESFEQIRRRLEAEALELGAPQGDAVDAAPACAPAYAPDTREEYAAPCGVTPTPADGAGATDSARQADAVFGSFDPLSGGAVIDSTPAILRPVSAPSYATASSAAGGRLTQVRPSAPTINRADYHTVEGGVQGPSGAVGSYLIHAEPLRTRKGREESDGAVTDSPAATQTDEDTQDTSLSAFEQITVREESEQSVNDLPYVHPATQPSEQEQIPMSGAIGAQAPQQAAPWGQQSYPVPNGGMPTQPVGYAPVGWQPYPNQPYPNQPYPNQPYAGYAPQPYPYMQPPVMPVPDGQAPVVPTPMGAQAPAPAPAPTQVTAPAQPSPVQAPVQSAPAAPATAPVSTRTATPATSATRQTQAAPVPTSYLFPPLSLLKRSAPIVNQNSESEIDELSDLLVAAFQKFRFAVEVKQVMVGPRITRFCISPPDGVRIQQLINLSSDIALNLAVESVRINPVPNTPYLGVEIPNRTPTTVRLSSLIDTSEFKNGETVTRVPLGATVTGGAQFADIAEMPHCLIAGATGMGKSVLMNSILVSLLYRARPDEVKLILVDPKRVELSVYSGIPHLLIPPVVEPQKAAGALIWAVGEMERRYSLMEKTGTRNIAGYNRIVRQDPTLGEPQPTIIIVIDELNDLMMQVRDAVEPAIARIAQKARAAGIHLIIGTQRPSVDVITGVIKANIPTRIALHVSSGTDSRTILDTVGAEKLLDKGDALASIKGREPVRMQSAFVTDEEVENVVTFLKQNTTGNTYDEIISAQIESETEKYKNAGKRTVERDEDDEADGDIFEDSRFMEACQVAFANGNISTSLLQRRIGLGYGKAAKYIDQMEMLGIVGPPNGTKPRELLMTQDQFMEMVSRRGASGD